MVSHSTGFGAVALVGSGEYLDVMNEVDTYLLTTLGGAARVALLPTASGLEPNGPASWNKLGMDHFKRLGIDDVRATRIIDRESAFQPEQVALLQGANFFYFSGGNPQHVIDTMRDSPAWNVIKTAYERGAVLAGCSAGAMMMGGYTISIRQAMQGSAMDFVAGLGVVPQVIVFPHFDRMAGFLSQGRFQDLLRAVPANTTVLGIDEDTALVRVEAGKDGHASARWRVMGRQTVSVFASDATVRIVHVGENIEL